MLIIFGRVASIFLLILIGYVTNRMKILPDSSRKHLTSLMLYITAPCMAASSIYSKELSPKVITATKEVIIGAIVYFVIVNIFAYFIIKALKYKPKADRGVFLVAITSINTGFMGFPITKAIFGDDLFYLMVMHNIILNIYLYAFVPFLLDIGEEKKSAGGFSNLKKILNPCIVGIVVGIVFLMMGIKPPGPINEVVTSLSDATIPLSMIIVGVQLGGANIREMMKNKYVNITNIIAMVIIPILTFVIVEQMKFLLPEVRCVLVLASVFPTAVVPAAIAEQQGKDATRLAELVSLTTATSLVTIPLISAFLMSYYF